eukprot:6491380-Amphidinium_carterae.3
MFRLISDSFIRAGFGSIGVFGPCAMKFHTGLPANAAGFKRGRACLAAAPDPLADQPRDPTRPAPGEMSVQGGAGRRLDISPVKFASERAAVEAHVRDPAGMVAVPSGCFPAPCSDVGTTSVDGNSAWAFEPARLGAPVRKKYKTGSKQKVEDVEGDDRLTSQALRDYEADKLAFGSRGSLDSRLR